MLNGHITAGPGVYVTSPIYEVVNDVNVSFADFEQNKAGQSRVMYSGYQTSGVENDISLNLTLQQRTDNYFVADQTPTPTRLIKNCEEVGLFDDLRDVNPFEEGFRRAVEQQVNGSATSYAENVPNDTGSLNTPQVYAIEGQVEIEAATKHVESGLLPTADSTLIVQPTAATVIEVAQPQIITWLIPASAPELTKPTATAIPVQTVRPFLLPKPDKPERTPMLSPLLVAKPTKETQNAAAITATVSPQPSSASLTPTSQLPIKERLKAILNNNKLRTADQQEKFTQQKTLPEKKSHKQPSTTHEAFMERRRAAAARYRNKIRNEKKVFRQRFDELKNENDKLRQRIKELEQKLTDVQNSGNSRNNTAAGTALLAMPCQNQVQLPPSSFHLIINVPPVPLPTTQSNQT